MINIPNKDYKKRFPSDISMEYTTFLNDKDTDAELYAYFLHKSIVVTDPTGKKRTFCPYEACSKKIVGEFFGISQPTVRKKFNHLIEKHFIEPAEKKQTTGYYLNVPEARYIDIPEETIQFLVVSLKEAVIKIYLYLGIKQRWCKNTYGTNYNFTKEELIDHCGIKMGRDRQGYKTVDMILTILKDAGMCVVKEVRIDGVVNPKLEVTYWTEVKKIEPTAGTIDKTAEEASKGPDFNF